jgi:uncharacterized protein YjiS (DUF1127 family)
MPALTRSLTRHQIAWPHLSARNLLARLASADVLYRQRFDLARLDTRMLSDIGINQAEVAAELRHC